MSEGTVAAGDISKCSSCSTELGPTALACPSCRTLVHAGLLKHLAATAEEWTAANDLAAARDAWSRALALLPNDTQQYAAVRAHIASLNDAISKQAALPAAASNPSDPRWKRAMGGAAAVALLALGKLKFLLLGLTKASTFFSMFAFAGVYWQTYGWALALGLVVSIYIHEMGHVAAIRKLGIDASAPMFIPGIGALVRLRQHIDDPVVDARIGLAGPLWGLGAGLVASTVGLITHSHTWYAIAQLTAYVNLFNLIPVWQLDGSRGFHALDRSARWIVVAAAAAMYFLAGKPLLLLIGAVGTYRAFKANGERTDRSTLVKFVVLLVALSLMASIPVALTQTH